jgi:hypothetical protein
VDLGSVLGIRAFSLDRILEEEPDFLKARELCPFASRWAARIKRKPL